MSSAPQNLDRRREPSPRRARKKANLILVSVISRSFGAASDPSLPGERSVRRLNVSDDRLATLVHINMLNSHELRAAVSQPA
jgi:hypothetical protein